MAIEVSLCGPGSLLTSMLEPTETLPVFPGLGSGRNPGADTVSNFCHQVGRLYAEAPVPVPAEAGSAQPTANVMLATAAVATKDRSRAIRLALPTGVSTPNGMLAQAGDNGNHPQHHLKLPRAALAQVTTVPVGLHNACSVRRPGLHPTSACRTGLRSQPGSRADHAPGAGTPGNAIPIPEYALHDSRVQIASVGTYQPVLACSPRAATPHSGREDRTPGFCSVGMGRDRQGDVRG